MEVGKGQVKWSFDGTFDYLALTRLLPSLLPLQKHLIGEISLTLSSLSEHRIWSPDGQPRSGRCLMSPPQMRETLRLDDPYHLIIRLDPDESLLEQIVELPQTDSVIPSGSRQCFPHAETQARIMKWTKGVLQLGYLLLMDGAITKMSFQQCNAREELRSQFYPAPSQPPLLINRLKHYLYTNELNKLHVELVWSNDSKHATVCFTKKRLNDHVDVDRRPGCRHM